MKKRILPVILCMVMLCTMLCTVTPTVLTASAYEVEGDWTTHRFADEYDEEGYNDIYKPISGYQYTDEGFSTVSPDYTHLTPRMSVMTKEVQEVKEGIYLQFRVDDFSYGGDDGADEWIALTLSTREKVCPGSTAYGGGWLALVRGAGDGNCVGQMFLTEPDTETEKGTFRFEGQQELSVPRDNQGREIYTLEITWDGAAYEMKLNDVILPGGEATTALLEELSSYGEFFLGIGMHSTVENGSAALTILKYGTCEADATTPVGVDRRYPDDGGCGWPGDSDILYPPEASTEPPAETDPPAETELADEDNPTYDRPQNPVPPAVEDTAAETEAADTEDPALRDVMEKYGCTAALAGGVLLPLLLGAVLWRKKED